MTIITNTNYVEKSTDNRYRCSSNNKIISQEQFADSERRYLELEQRYQEFIKKSSIYI